MPRASAITRGFPFRVPLRFESRATIERICRQLNPERSMTSAFALADRLHQPHAFDDDTRRILDPTQRSRPRPLNCNPWMIASQKTLCFAVKMNFRKCEAQRRRADLAVPIGRIRCRRRFENRLDDGPPAHVMTAWQLESPPCVDRH